MPRPDHMFVACDGDLHDTRQTDWSRHHLRHRYEYTFGRMSTLAQVKATLRNGAFAWPGGYPMYLITSDGAALCFPCARKEFRQVAWDYMRGASTGWRVEACDINYEDAALHCDHCSKRIESAYAEDNAA